ncbi:MAG: phosphotransferase [Rickettsiales bacterium]|nr:phosphotransferase [Rickettsiales bacterium]
MAATMEAVPKLITREHIIQNFLQQANWSDATRQAIPGDASYRRYERLTRGDASAILMDAPPERENTRAFVNAQRYLARAGYSAPAILQASPDEGLLLLEDFGNDSVTLRLRENPAEEAAIYADAIDLLAHMAGQGLQLTAESGSQFSTYDASLLLQEAMLFAQWLLPEILPVAQVVEAVESYEQAWQLLLEEADLTPAVVTHRDFHADNLFILSWKEGLSRIGLLDFQDAVLGRPAYDVVSLLEDARRDVDAAVVDASLKQFVVASGLGTSDFLRDYAFYGAQRNAKILGIFTRLYRRDGKPRYLAMLPRVWRYFDRNIEHPSLAALQAWRQRYIMPEVVQRILNLHALLAEPNR